MKRLQLIIIIFLFICGCAKAQNNASEKQTESMLLEFYTKHFQIWTNTPATVPANMLYEKLDSLMQKYCTLKLRNNAKKAFKYVGADFVTNELMGNLNENLKIEKATKENEYIVSFVATHSDAPGGAIKKQAILHVTVVKEGESYKIDSVK